MGQYSDSSDYNYTPSPAWCLSFVVIFSVIALILSLQALRSKYWVVYPTLVLGALIEVLGWAGRYWSSQNVLRLTPFLMQITTLILAPVWFSAYDYTLLGIAIRSLGEQYSLLRPLYYLMVFLTADLISLILQAVGGGQAAGSAADGSPTTSATHIMVAGIIFQLISMGFFVGLGIDFVVRTTLKKPYAFRERQMVADAQKKANKRAKAQRMDSAQTLPVNNSDQTLAVNNSVTATKPEGGEPVVAKQNQNRYWLLLLGAMISSVMIVIRGIYRSIELEQGWSGRIIKIQMFQNALDGIPMVIAVGIFIFFDIGILLGKKQTWKGYH